MRRALMTACAVLAMCGASHAAPLYDRLASFYASLDAAPCSTDTDCEARARAHGIDPDWLDIIDECDGGDDAACELIDSAIESEGN
jgi:hypothetical protein